MEYDIKNCIAQLEQSINVLMPGDELFNNDDFNLNRNRVSNFADLNQFVPIETLEKKRDAVANAEEDEQEHDFEEENEEEDETESEEDFEEVPLNKSLEQINEERRIEMEYLGFANGKKIQPTTSQTNEGNSNMTIDINLNENEDNRVLIQTIRDLYKELESSHLLKVATWIKVLLRLFF